MASCPPCPPVPTDFFDGPLAAAFTTVHSSAPSAGSEGVTGAAVALGASGVIPPLLSVAAIVVASELRLFAVAAMFGGGGEAMAGALTIEISAPRNATHDFSTATLWLSLTQRQPSQRTH